MAEIDVPKLLLATYGETFLRYVLAVDEDAELLAAMTKAIPAIPEAIQPLQLFVLQQLLDGESGSTKPSVGDIANLLVRTSDQDMSLAKHMRAISGGEVEKLPRSSDKVLNEALEIASDVWPIWLLPPRDQSLAGLASVLVMSHSRCSALLRAFVEDSSLQKLFPGSLDLMRAGGNDMFWANGVQASWALNLGPTGGGRQLFAAISGLLFDAIVRTQIEGEKLELKRIADALSRSLDVLRRLAEGEEVAVPVVVGFGGISFDETAEVRLSSGVLRKASQFEREVLLNLDGTEAIVFHTSVGLRILGIAKSPSAGGENDLFLEVQEGARKTFQRDLDKVRLELVKLFV